MKTFKNYITATLLVAILLFLCTILLGYLSLSSASDIYNQIKLVIIFAYPYLISYISYPPLAVGFAILISAIIFVVIITLIRKILKK